MLLKVDCRIQGSKVSYEKNYYKSSSEYTKCCIEYIKEKINVRL